MDEFLTLDSDSASDIFPSFNLDLFPRLLEESNDNLSLELSISSDGKNSHFYQKRDAVFLKIEWLWIIGNRTEFRPIRSVIIRVIKQIGRRGYPILLFIPMITDRIGLHSILLP